MRQAGMASLICEIASQSTPIPNADDAVVRPDAMSPAGLSGSEFRVSTAAISPKAWAGTAWSLSRTAARNPPRSGPGSAGGPRGFPYRQLHQKPHGLQVAFQGPRLTSGATSRGSRTAPAIHAAGRTD